MDPHITLTVVNGKLDATRFNRSCCGRYLIGRSRDCDIVLKGDDVVSISRHHCLLIIEQARVSVRDLGSRNGTYINGEFIGCRLDEVPSIDDKYDSNGAHELNDGDEIQIGKVAFRIAIDNFVEATDSPFIRRSGHVHSTI